MAISYPSSNREASDAVGKIWGAIKEVCTSRVIRINPVSGTIYGEERTIFIGEDAARWARDGDLLAGTAANVYFAPASA